MPLKMASLPSSRLKPPLLSSSSMPAKGAAEAVTTEVIERLYFVFTRFFEWCRFHKIFYNYFGCTLHICKIITELLLFLTLNNNISKNEKKTESTARSEKQSTATEMNFCRRRVLLIFVAFRAGKETGRANTSLLSHQEPPSAFWPSPKDQNRATKLLRHILFGFGARKFYQYLQFLNFGRCTYVSIFFWIF